jgi:hypothetical protein
MRRVESADTLDGEMVYKMAQAYAQLGDGESSVRLLRRSIEVNFYPSSYFLQDPLLAPIRAKPEYSSLMELAGQRQEAFRKQFF